MVRYGIASVVALVVIAAGAAFVLHTRTEFVNRVRHALRAEKEAGRLPPELQDADLEHIDGCDLGIELPTSEKFKLLICEVIARHWLVLGSAVLGISLAIAALIGRIQAA